MILQTVTQNWICPKCNNELGELNGYCVYCKIERNEMVYNPDKYCIRDIRIYHITHQDNTLSEAKRMTPQEELFSQLFNHEKILVRDMDTLMLRAHREELAKIAFEARARLTAVDDEEQSRKKAINKENKPKGFERSLNVDETTTDAINTIKERQKRLTKQEKIQAQLEKLGISTTDATKLMTAGVILGRIQSKAKEEAETPKVSESKPVFNPFAKKE